MERIARRWWLSGRYASVSNADTAGRRKLEISFDESSGRSPWNTEINVNSSSRDISRWHHDAEQKWREFIANHTVAILIQRVSARPCPAIVRLDYHDVVADIRIFLQTVPREEFLDQSRCNRCLEPSPCTDRKHLTTRIVVELAVNDVLAGHFVTDRADMDYRVGKVVRKRV